MKPVHLLACLVAFSSVLAGQAVDSSSVEGQVINAGTGAPLRGAVVTLQRSSGRAVRPGEPPQPPMSNVQVETDDQGHFAFRGLEAGGYRITAQRQGYVNPNQMGVNFANSQLWLGEGQQLTGYVVRVTAQSVIAGKVLDEYGEPVMGAQVYAQRAAGSANGGRPATVGGVVQSNDLGEYRIANLSAGDYLVAAVPPNTNRPYVAQNQPFPDKPQLIYATTYHPGTAVAGEAAPVHVADGAVLAGTDIKLAKVNAYAIRGTVVDPDAPMNGPRAFPQLRLHDPTGFPGGGYFGPSYQQDGSFTIPNVPPGSYDLFAQRSNPGTPGSVASASMPIEVRDKNLDGIVLQMKPNAELQGTVKLEQPGQCDLRNMSVSLRPASGVYYGGNVQPVNVADDLKFTLKNVPAGVYSVNVTGGLGRCYVKSILYGGQAAPENALAVTQSGPLEIMLASYSATLSVSVVDRDGNPLPRARVSLVPKETGMGTMGSMTSFNGQIDFASIRPGTYQVYAWESAAQNVPQTPDYLKTFESRAKTVTVGESGRTSIEVVAIPASEIAGAAPPPPPAAKGSLAGKVVNAVSGSAIAGVAVTLRGQANFTNQSQAGQGTSVVTDPQGRFSFPDLTPGTYTLMSVGQRFAGAGLNLNGYPPGQVIVGEGQQISAYVMKLIPEGVIAGAVKDASGEPVLGAQVLAYRYRNDLGQRRVVSGASAHTDDLGQYRIANLGPGNYLIQAHTASGTANPATADPTTGFATPRGTPQPAPDTIAGPLPTEPETDYVPVWYPNSPQPAAASVKLAAGATVGNIDMTLRRGRVVRIRGRVVDPSGGPVGTPMVELMLKNAEVMAQNTRPALVAKDGTFEIAGVAPGSYNLIARPGATPASPGVATMNIGGVMGGRGGGTTIKMAVQSIEVEDSPIEGIRLELGPGRTVKGVIKTEGGPAAQAVRFNLTSTAPGGSGTINFGNDGTFTVNGVFPLVYTLNAQNLPANSFIKSVRYAGREVPVSSIEFTGQGDLEVTVSNTAAVLEGAVTSADGKPAGNAGVVIAPSSGPSPIRTGNADAHGNFYFGSLPPGEYKVLAWDATTPEASDPPESLGPFAAAAKTVKLAENAHEKVQVTVVPAAK